MITGGPIQFTPQEIAFLLALIAAVVLIRTAPLAVLAAWGATRWARNRGRRALAPAIAAYVLTVAVEIYLVVRVPRLWALLPSLI